MKLITMLQERSLNILCLSVRVSVQCAPVSVHVHAHHKAEDRNPASSQLNKDNFSQTPLKLVFSAPARIIVPGLQGRPSTGSLYTRFTKCLSFFSSCIELPQRQRLTTSREAGWLLPGWWCGVVCCDVAAHTRVPPTRFCKRRNPR